MATENTDRKNEIITKYVTDVHALVEHGLTTIERQAENLKDVSHQQAKAAVAAFVVVLKKQKTELEARVKALGGSTSQPVKDAASAIAGVAAGVINAIRPSETVKSIRDDHTYFNHLGVAWLMLYTTVTSLGDTDTGRLAESGYVDITKVIMHINRILPGLVVEELREDKQLSPTDTSTQTGQMVKKAWDREAPESL